MSEGKQCWVVFGEGNSPRGAWTTPDGAWAAAICDPVAAGASPSDLQRKGWRCEQVFRQEAVSEMMNNLRRQRDVAEVRAAKAERGARYPLPPEGLYLDPPLPATDQVVEGLHEIAQEISRLTMAVREMRNHG